MPSEKIVVFSAASSIEEAEKVSDALLDSRKVACVNIIPRIMSRYWWKGKIEREEEVLLIAKSSRDMLDDVIRIVKENHSYETPEIVAVDIAGGSADYLAWLSAELGETS